LRRAAARTEPRVPSVRSRGAALAALFLALPVWLGRAETGGVHFSAMMLWPMALGGVALMAIGWRNGCFGLRIMADGFEFHDISGIRTVPRAAVLAQRPRRRGLPGWMRAIAPVLPPTTAGAILLESTATKLNLWDSHPAQFLIHADCREGGRHGWGNRILLICASGL